MAELIDKKNLFNNLFVRNGKVCPNSDIDNFPTTIDVKEVKKAILEQPTTTDSEIRAKVLQEIIDRMVDEKEACHINAEFYTEKRIGKLIDFAEQLKEESE